MSKVSSTIIKDSKEIIFEINKSLNKLSNSTILLTGVNGFLCSYILDVLSNWNELNNNCKIIAIDNLKTGISSRLSHLKKRKDILFIKHDVSKKLKINHKIDWIIHGASIASPIKYRKFPLETIEANVNGTRQMLDLAKRNNSKGIIIMSTSEIYGNPDAKNIPTKEIYNGNVSCFGPRACYDESKRLAETLSFIYKTKFNIPVKIIRPFNVFGPGQNLYDQRIIPDLMNCVLSRKEIKLFSDGKSTRSFCYVKDAAKAILKILVNKKTNGQAYNVGNDEIEISIKELSIKMSKISKQLLGRQPKINFLINKDKDYNTDNPRRRCPNLNKIKKTISWKPEIKLEDALKRTLISYIEIEKKKY